MKQIPSILKDKLIKNFKLLSNPSLEFNTCDSTLKFFFSNDLEKLFILLATPEEFSLFEKKMKFILSNFLYVFLF